MRRAVHRLIACPACPCGVAGAVAEAGLMAYEDLVGAEGVAAWATHGWLGNPLPARCSDQLTLHLVQPIVPRFLDHALLWLWRVGAR